MRICRRSRNTGNWHGIVQSILRHTNLAELAEGMFGQHFVRSHPQLGESRKRNGDHEKTLSPQIVQNAEHPGEYSTKANACWRATDACGTRHSTAAKCGKSVRRP